MPVLPPSRRTVLRGLAASSLAAAAVGTRTAAVSATSPAPRRARRGDRPNVLVISIDDLGWDELGCYGNTFNETPHIDALAAGGVRFTQAYAAAPLCSPTRAALVTGLYPARTGITDFLRAEGAPSSAHLSPDVPTVPDVLGPFGYTSGLVGKWHLTETYSGDYAARPGNPFAHGFDEVLASEERYIGDGDYFHPYAFIPSLPPETKGEYLTDRLAERAVDFLTRNADRPFFLHLSNYSVHTRLDADPDLVAKYAAKPGADELPNRPVLAAMLESVDGQVGAVVEALTDLGIRDDTLLLVISDNGGPYRDANLPLRGGKGELYEGGIRVPMVASWPGRLGAKGRTVDGVTSTIDILPTALDLAGGSPAGHELDGVSIVPLLTGGLPSIAREPMFWVYPHHIGRSHPRAAVRDGDLKLIQDLRDGSTELYRLDVDEGESDDVSDRFPEEARRLRRLLEDHLAEVDVIPPPPSAKGYPAADLEPGWDGYDVLAVPAGSHTGQVAVTDGRLTVTTDRATHVLLRSPVAPSSDQVAAVLEPGAFAESGAPETVFVGLAQDADNYLLLRYRHDLRRVGWDLRVAGQLITAGGEPLDTLDGTVDLTAPGARYGFVLRGSEATAFVDQGGGGGWEFLFTVDTGGAFDLRDPALRARTRYTASARLTTGTLTLDALSADRAG